MASNSFESAIFQSLKYDFAKSMGVPCSCPEEEARLFDALGSMASFREHGPLLKLAMWMSVNPCWHFLRPELPALRLILGELLQMDPEQIALHATELTTQQSTDSKVIQEMAKPSGTIQIAYDWIRPSNIMTMDMVDLLIEATQHFDN